jgi:thiol:disulfide interchange protein DsbD
VLGYWFFLESTLNVRQAIAGTQSASDASTNLTVEGIQWQPFSVSSLDAHLKEKKTVFIDFTAEWCLTCKVNEKTVISSKDVVERMKKDNIVTIRADWTNRNPDITRLLQKFGRSGVPLYVVFPAGRPNEPIVLPEVVTPGLILEAFDKAAQL